MLYAEGNITGRGFVTHEDRTNGLNPLQMGNIIIVEDTSAGTAWLSRNSLTAIDNIIDNWNDSDMQPVIKPTKGTLP